MTLWKHHCGSTYRQLQDFVEHDVWGHVEVKHKVLGGERKNIWYGLFIYKDFVYIV